MQKKIRRLKLAISAFESVFPQPCWEQSAEYLQLSDVLSVTTGLDSIMFQFCTKLENRRSKIYKLTVTLMLQHGARTRYSAMYGTFLPGDSSTSWELVCHNEQHSERFVQLLRAADMHFNGARQEIADIHNRGGSFSNLLFLNDKLSQPLTLQAWCVIGVRRQLRSVSNSGMWSKIDELCRQTYLTHMSDRLKLKVW